MNLKVYILPPLNLIFSEALLNIVVYQMLIATNVPVNSAALQQFMQYVTLLLILVDTGLRNFICPCQQPEQTVQCDGCENISVSISGAEINLTLRAVTTYLLCCSKHVCIGDVHIFKHCHEMTLFLLWIGTYCISCVVQQTSGVKDLSSLVRYDDSSLAVSYPQYDHAQIYAPIAFCYLSFTAGSARLKHNLRLLFQ